MKRLKSSPLAAGLPWLGLLCLFALLVTVMAPASLTAQDCKRGTLDTRFCDEDGNLTADLPKDKSKWVDPKVIIFAYTPVEDPSVYKTVWDGFLRHMEKTTGRKVRFFAVQSNAAQIEAMRAGRLHVAGFNTGSNPLAVNCAGFVPFTIMASKNGHFGYEMEIITHIDSGIMKVEDLKGKSLAFTAPTSNSGFKAPSALLKAEFNMIKDRDFKATFSGKHDNSILGVYNKDYLAASIANSVMRRMHSRGVIDKNKIRTIYKSQTFPTTGFGHVYNMQPDLAKKVRESFFSFDWEGSKLKEEFKKSGEEQFLEMNYKKFWAVIRTIDKANGVSYKCQ